MNLMKYLIQYKITVHVTNCIFQNDTLIRSGYIDTQTLHHSLFLQKKSSYNKLNKEYTGNPSALETTNYFVLIS